MKSNRPERGMGGDASRRLEYGPAGGVVRHADFEITMEIYTKVSSKATCEALKKLGESLDR